MSTKNDLYFSLQQVKSFINQTLVDRAYGKYKQNRLVEYLRQRQSPQGAKYTQSLLQKAMQNQLLQPSIRTTQFEQHCPEVTVDQVKAKMVKLNQQRNSSINFRNYEIDSFSRTHRYKDTFIENQLDQSEIQRKQRGGIMNRTSYFSDCQQKDLKRKIYRHQKTLTEINPNRKKYNNKSKKLVSLIEYQHGIRHETVDQVSAKHNRQIERQIQSLRNRKMKLEAAFSSFNQNKMKSFFGENINEKPIDGEKNKSSTVDSFSKNKKEKDSQPQYKCIITDYDGEVIAPLVTQKLKKVNAKNKQNLAKNTFMPIVRVKTEITSNYLEHQQNQKPFKPSRKFIKHKDTICKPLSTAKQSKHSQKLVDQNNKQKVQKVSVYKTQDDWTNFDMALKKKPQECKRDNVKITFDIDELSKSRRMIQKINKSQKKLV